MAGLAPDRQTIAEKTPARQLPKQRVARDKTRPQAKAAAENHTPAACAPRPQSATAGERLRVREPVRRVKLAA
jgi:hypothetical protein